MQDVNELRRRNAELESNLGREEIPPGNWEAQKRRLLEALEEEENPSDRRAGERSTIEGTMQITFDRLVAG